MPDHWYDQFSQRIYPAGPLRGAALMSYLNSCDVCIVPAARRRLRRKAHRERWSEEEGWPALPAAYTEKWPALRDPPTGCSEYGSGPPDGNYCAIASDASGLSTPATIVGTSTQPVSDGPPRDHEPETPPAISRRVLAAIERVWDLEQNPDPDCNIDDWDIANPNESKIGRAAEHAALLLDVFSRVKPVDDSQLTTVQKGLIAKALSSVLEITQHIRVLAATASIPLEPLPVADDPALSVYLGCVVCYARVSDMLMMPCRHLTLCEECCDEVHDRVRGAAAGEVMRCPVCRTDVLERVKIFRA